MKELSIRELEDLAHEVVTLAEKAGEAIASLYQTDIKVISKADGSPVTLADHQSHEIIEAQLRRLTPEIQVISEEGDVSPPSSDRYWLVDPLDGTRGFIYHSGNFCVNIALIDKHHPVLGCIHVPLTQESYVGFAGEHGFWQDKEGVCHPLRSSGMPAEGARALVGHISKNSDDEQGNLLKKLNARTVHPIGSAIKFCMLAKGEADLYVRTKPSYEWDTAAGHALIEACGGRVLNLDKTPLTYGKPKLLNAGFVVICDETSTW